MRVLAALVIVVALCTHASAQSITPKPPGPFVIDLRGAMVGVPQSASLYSTMPVGTVVPARGFGAEIGVHVYPMRLGPARVGIGATFTEVRGTASTVAGSTTSTSSTSTSSSSSSSSSSSATTPVVFPDTRIWQRAVAPQVSLNFGTHDGWSYLSAGYGPVREKTEAVFPGGVATASSSKSAVDVGGGARWFLKEHLGFGFDLRFFRIPSAMVVALSAGFSVR